MEERNMKIIIIGLEAAGAAAATKARKNSKNAEIVVYDDSDIVSHIPCGIPYYLGGEISEINELIARDERWFKKQWNIDVFANHRVINIKQEVKQIDVYNKNTGETFVDTYDKLIIATGASPMIPPPFNTGTFDNMFQVRSVEDAAKIQHYIQTNHVGYTTIVGSGSIGLEIAEQLTVKGIQVTIVEMAPQLLPRMDLDITHMIEQKMREKGVQLILGDVIQDLSGGQSITGYKTAKGLTGKTDMVIMATGVRPNTQLAVKAGIKLGPSRAIAVDKKMQTSVSDIFAAGDVAESYSLITGDPLYMPLAATATKTGRIAGDAATGGRLEHKGVLGTGLFRAFELTVGQTGFIERQVKEKGIDSVLVYAIQPDKKEAMGGKDIVIKALADRQTKRLLGAQIIGESGVDKRLDVLATAITFGAKVDDLQHLDLGYSMPYSTPWDPVHLTGMLLENAIEDSQSITPQELISLQNSHQEIQIIDVRSKVVFEESHIVGAINIPMDDLKERMNEVKKDLPTIVYCDRGKVSYAAQHLLWQAGLTPVYSLSGGNIQYQQIIESEQEQQALKMR